MTEAELAEKFINYFSDKYEIYKEVPSGVSIIDFVAVSDNIKIAVEVKRSLSFEVIEQGFRSLPFAHYVYIAVPYTKNHTFAHKICKDYGIGVLEYKNHKIFKYTIETNQETYDDVSEVVEPKLNRKPVILKLEEYMKRSVAGSQNNRVTAFKNTVESISSYLKKHNGERMEKVLENVNFHWTSISAAKSAIYQWCKSGVIKEFYVEKGKLFLSLEKS